MTELAIASTALSLARENERLRAELGARVAELRACRARLIHAIDTERRRIERDLHDATQGRLVSLAMLLGLLDAKLPDHPDDAKPITREARHAVAAALEDLRRVSHGIYPSALIERGLEAALDELCERTPIPTVLRVSVDARQPDDAQTAAYFVVSEAVTNATKHAHARELRISAWCHHHNLILEIQDDGIGGATTGRGSGLRGIADRVEALGGLIALSSPPGRGTTLRAEIPSRPHVGTSAGPPQTPAVTARQKTDTRSRSPNAAQHRQASR
jgi:signal transduction histidine kinase